VGFRITVVVHLHFYGSPYDLSTATNWPGSENQYSVVNRYTFSRLMAPTIFLTFGENQLLLADARNRGLITGTTEAAY
jgi:hypothetical protein